METIFLKEKNTVHGWQNKMSVLNTTKPRIELNATNRNVGCKRDLGI